jgi:hypothetical protein
MSPFGCHSGRRFYSEPKPHKLLNYIEWQEQFGQVLAADKLETMT